MIKIWIKTVLVIVVLTAINSGLNYLITGDTAINGNVSLFISLFTGFGTYFMYTKPKLDRLKEENAKSKR